MSGVVYPVALTGADQSVRAGPCHYVGFAIYETTGSAAATVLIYDNPSVAAGILLDIVKFAAGESVREFYPGGVRAVAGIYVHVVTGAVAGSVRVG